MIVQVLDVNGDTKPDLLVTADCADAKVGLAYWSFFANGGAGFAASPTHVALPPGYSNVAGSGAFRSLGSQAGPYCDSRNVPNYALMNLDGDTRPDLVVSADCTKPQVGATSWLVFEEACP